MLPFLPLAGLLPPIECCRSHSSQVWDAGSTGNMSGLVSVGLPSGELETCFSSAKRDCRSSSSAPRNTSWASSVMKSPSSAGTVALPTPSPSMRLNSLSYKFRYFRIPRWGLSEDLSTQRCLPTVEQGPTLFAGYQNPHGSGVTRDVLCNYCRT